MVNDAYPIPRIDESLSKLGHAKFFTTLDLGSVFWQVLLRKQDRDKTGFALRAGIVPMEKDALRPLQRDSHIPATDGTSTDKRQEEKWQLGDLLRR